MADTPVYVTKDDAREAQRAEALLYGGYTPGQGMAASMQVSWRHAGIGSNCTDWNWTRRVQRTRSSIYEAGTCSEDARWHIEINRTTHKFVESRSGDGRTDHQLIQLKAAKVS